MLLLISSTATAVFSPGFIHAFFSLLSFSNFESVGVDTNTNERETEGNLHGEMYNDELRWAKNTREEEQIQYFEHDLLIVMKGKKLEDAQ